MTKRKKSKFDHQVSRLTDSIIKDLRRQIKDLLKKEKEFKKEWG